LTDRPYTNKLIYLAGGVYFIVNLNSKISINTT